MKFFFALTLSFIIASGAYAQSFTPEQKKDTENLVTDMRNNTSLGLALDDLYVPKNRKYAVSMDTGIFNNSTSQSFQFGYRLNDKWFGNGGFAYSEKTHDFGGRLSISREWAMEE